MSRRVAVIVLVVVVLMSASASLAWAGRDGSPGPCAPGTPLEADRLGWDVAWIAQNIGTPLPDTFAFEGGEAMAPGRLLQFARANGLC